MIKCGNIDECTDYSLILSHELPDAGHPETAHDRSFL
jgi:hypothetical protein